MVSDGTKFAEGDIERLFEEARRNTKAKHEKWEKYYNRRMRDVQIKVNNWVLIATHPLSSATRKVVAKFKSKFKGPYRVLDVKNNNVVIWKVGKRLTINADQVRIYRHRKCDETEIGTGSSDNGSLRDKSSGFDRVQRRSNESQDGKKKGSEVKCELEEKDLSFKNNQGPERKIQKGSEHRVPKRALSSNYKTNSNLPKFRKKSRREETVTPTTSGYNLRRLHEVGKEWSLDTSHREEDQFDPEKVEEGTTASTSKSEQDQTTGMLDEEVINNGRTRKGKERVRESHYPWRSW
ncbi:uncharacterized protein TNCV_1041251 [Trichonephila clavipes]|nr:uncharacterized protein TNCV_1041251 [Trichonephila clavipes]